jgi:hypothetical protein
LKPIVGGDSAVCDVFEVEVVVSRGEEGFVVPGGDNAPMGSAYCKSVSPSCKARVGLVFHVGGEDACKCLDCSCV